MAYAIDSNLDRKIEKLIIRDVQGNNLEVHDGLDNSAGYHRLTSVLQQMGLDAQRLDVPGRKRIDIHRGQTINEIIA